VLRSFGAVAAEDISPSRFFDDAIGRGVVGCLAADVDVNFEHMRACFRERSAADAGELFTFRECCFSEADAFVMFVVVVVVVVVQCLFASPLFVSSRGGGGLSLSVDGGDALVVFVATFLLFERVAFFNTAAAPTRSARRRSR